MKVLFFKNRFNKVIAKVCILSLSYQLLFPITSLALTSGPSQPEVQSFEPVGTTDMVNMFSGDFNYNIPLLDVDGYPVNIAYHAGVNMEQEASWVGLGWNINPGNINHIVRGFSDDFNGDIIEKKVDVEEETNSVFQLFGGVEFSGLNMDKLSVAAKKALKNLKNARASSQTNFGISINNYSGLSAFIGQSGGIGVNTPWISPGINMGTTVSTDRGVDVDYSLSLQSRVSNYVGGSISVGRGLNSLEGVKYSFLGVNPSLSTNPEKRVSASVHTSINHTNIPTGLQTYIPVVTNATSMKSSFFQLKVGAEVYLLYPFGGGSYAVNTISVKSDGTKKAYGYYNLGNATADDIVDFSREKDGRINKKTKYLPMSNLTYDIYAVNAHGAGGNFRPHRNDVGAVGDPILGSNAQDQKHLGELGIGSIFELGYDLKTSYTQASSGPWEYHTAKYRAKSINSFFEPHYLKQAGEFTGRNEKLFDYIKGKKDLTYQEAKALLVGNTAPAGEKRVTRANMLYYLTAEEASQRQISLLPKLPSCDFDGFKNLGNWNTASSDWSYHDRYDDSEPTTRKHASEYTQITPDGRRYIYGLPVRNLHQSDYEVAIPGATEITDFSINNPNAPNLYSSDGTVKSTGTPKFSSKTTIPAYAHSYMLTSILSTDYVDLTGNGITDDDLGNFTKFNYRKRENYNWRIPYQANTGQRNYGLKSDCKDDRVAFSAGSREQWTLHSIESKTMVAEFYTSKRGDAMGALDANIFGTVPMSYSYKLDSIVLFNKDERRADPATATRIKTIVFYYDYSLCKGSPNSTALSENNNLGKLTLKSIFIKEGNSDIGFLSPYQFKYTTSNPNYNPTEKDCWGNYKPGSSNLLPGSSNLDINNTQYPYVNQNDPNIDVYSAAWNLEEIKLPSGGKIKVSYEADDYGYVQDKPAMEMFRVMGVGPTSKFEPNATLYNDPKDPYLYVYFKRKNSKEHGNSISNTYLNGGEIMQFTFDVKISPNNSLGSCPNTPTTETVKGYARVVESGICTNNGDYGYFKMEPKSPNNLISLEKLDIPGAKINPVSLAAINLARYYNPKLLNPETDIPSTAPGAEKALINSLISSIGDNINMFQNPLKTYIKKGKAKSFELGKSYVRLVTPGLKKKGGGHRVKKLEFFDTWSLPSNEREASYGSEYDYTTTDERTGTVVSSGVASYEPLFGGDENPCRTLLDINEYGNSSSFPPVDPIEVLQETPLGESQYPPASVGYSKVTVRSIHRNNGEASQAIQQSEFYTAKDFPVTITNTGLQVLEDKPARIWQIKHKRESYRVAQGYALALNDMHGKPKRNSTWVRKYDPANLSANPKSNELVTYTAYNYFRNEDNTLNNTIPCVDFPENGVAPIVTLKTVGEDFDITLDSREKIEETNFFNFSFNVNCFLAPPVAIAIPLGFPIMRKQSKTFSSFVNTKVIQKYGILQSVETYDKGALIMAENTAFDYNTGEALVTTVNTEYNDNERTIKHPAYWAYKGMGHAYENILFEERVYGSIIEDNKVYLNVSNPDNYNLGDELELDLTDLCIGADGRKYKVWVTGKKSITAPTTPLTCSSSCVNTTNVLRYRSGQDPNICITQDELKQILKDKFQAPDLLTIPNTIEKIEVWTHENPDKKLDLVDWYGILCHSAYCEVLMLGNKYKYESYYAEVNPLYNAGPVPYSAPYTHELWMNAISHTEEKTSQTNNNWRGRASRETHKIRIVTAANSSTLPSNSLYNLSYNDKITISANPFCGGFLHVYTPLTCPTVPFVMARHVRELDVYDVFPKQTKISYSTKYMVEATPYKVQAENIEGPNWGNPPLVFPLSDKVIEAKIKVVRSGKRNQLTESVQDVTIKTNKGDVFYGYSDSWGSVIHSSARTFTELAHNLGFSFDTYNPYIRGEKGTYRQDATYLPHQYRNSTLVTDNKSDKDNGLYNLSSYWKFIKPHLSAVVHNRMAANPDARWKRHLYTLFSVWGQPVQMIDAVGNVSGIQYDFGQKIPAATITQSGPGSFFFESFEDAKWLNKHGDWPLNTIDNPIKNWIKTMSNVVIGNSAARILVNSSRHTGNNAMEFLQNTDIPIPVFSIGDGLIYWTSFGAATGKKYIFSYWEKTSDNGTAPSPTSSVSLKFGSGFAQTMKAKTPVINGWVLYEGEIDVYPGVTNLYMSVPQGTIIDDVRMFLPTSNMKSYVYDDNYRRLAAVLDENHIATIFEYDNRGKLTRVKKETEKGILTIKESREALRELLSNGPYNQNY